MELIDDTRHAIDLRTTPLHLGLGSRARPIQGFAFEPQALGAYLEQTAADGTDGRLLIVIDEDGPGAHWERHGGDEVIVCLEGAVTVRQERDGAVDAVALTSGQAIVNLAGVWHTVDADGRARILTITPGVGTEQRPV